MERALNANMHVGATGPRIYNLFPRLCGPIPRWHAHLPRIQRMGFDWVFVNPIHATGASRSIYSIKDSSAYDEQLVSDGTDGDAALQAFCQAADEHGIRVMLDLVINHTATDSVLVKQHPDWYRRNRDGNLVLAGCEQQDGTTVQWDDLAELDYDDARARDQLIEHWIDFIERFAGLGVRGFRCDAAYQVPTQVWSRIIASAQRPERPLTFCAETLGCSLEQVEALAPAGFDFLFNSSKWWDGKEPWLLDQHEHLRHIAPSIAFPESHDTERLVRELADTSITGGPQIEEAYRQRYLLAATFSTGVLMPIGYEYGFAKRLHVVESTPADWEEPRFDLSEFIRSVNMMRAEHRVFNEEGPQRQLRLGHAKLTGLMRMTQDRAQCSILLFNRDPNEHNETTLTQAGVDLSNATELTPQHVDKHPSRDPTIVLQPGAARVFVTSTEAATRGRVSR